MSTKRPKRCSTPECKAPATKAGKCGAHYHAAYRAGVRVRQVEDLGPDPARFEFKGPRSLEQRFHAAVPKDQRSWVLRKALTDWLDRAAGADQT